MTVLEKPTGQECGNCYYCTSEMEEESITTGKIFIDVKTHIIEKFICNRYPIPPIMRCRSDWHELNFELFPIRRGTSRIHWCGEWRVR